MQQKPAPLLGILGGMGPLATADFHTRLVQSSSAVSDQDHLPMVIVADPRVPDRTAAIVGNKLGPVRDALIRGLRRLERAGATAVAIPCNTAHHWLEDLRRETPLDVFSIVESTLARLQQQVPDARRITVLATEGTRRAGIYDSPLEHAGLQLNALTDAECEHVHRAIREVKSGHTGTARPRLRRVIDAVRPRSDAVLLACTELPLALDLDLDLAESPWLIDTTEALIGRCIAWHRAHEPKHGA